VRHRLGTFVARQNGDDLLVLKDLIEAGKVAPVIAETYPLNDVREAMRSVTEGHHAGKIAISVSGPEGP
jgi:NADPH:quinone reductase-like Zn-dependent oxidoreductase